MPIYSRKNQYVGINAHLHSVMQNLSGTWGVFHSTHIIHLAEAINQRLPAGYTVVPEIGMQIREHHPHSGESAAEFLQRRQPKSKRNRRSIKPDISVYDREIERDTPASGTALAAPTAPSITMPTIDTFEDPEMFLTAVIIYRYSQEEGFGEPVAWLELLSPSNKPPGEGAAQYYDNRKITIRNRIVLVELDYLHQSPPVLYNMPSYADGEANAFPYHIAVSVPRPSPPEGKTNIYGFAVDAPMPVLDIPLSGKDVVRVDFGEVYQHTFESIDFFSQRVDYAAEPPAFETYSAADQARIRARMAAVSNAQTQGLDLEQGPFALERQ
ncbi:MAG: DUF4058 family protein [Burkholderiales bacterium]|nr:DUF4058 family protein [Anaerolineae bacterium]